MNHRVLPALLLALTLTACGGPRGIAGSVLPDIPATSMLAGQWTPTSAELAGIDYPITNFGGASLQMSGNSYNFAGDIGTFMVVSNGSPARMDIQGIEGPNAGHLIPALYQINGDDLTVSYQLGPGVRPKDFTSPAGSKILVVHYQRVR